MKKALIISGIVLLIIAIGVTAVLWTIYRHTNSIPAVLYYPDKHETTLVARSENIYFDDHAQIPSNIIKKLKSHGAINKNCEINTLGFEDSSRIIIDFDENFLSNNPTTDVLRVYAITKSICSVSSFLGITEVLVTSDGKDITAADGTPLGVLSESSINIMNSREHMTYMCELYFVAKNGSLRAEAQKIDAENGTIEYNIIKALINKPFSKALSSPFPYGTKLASAETANGICYVNFSDLPKSADMSIIKSSLKHTLSAQKDIDEIKILLNGKNISNRN